MTFTIPDRNPAITDPQLQSKWFQADISILVSALAGTGVVSGCAVTAQGTPDMTVAVEAGIVATSWVRVTVAAGNLSVDAADSTNPRLDLVSVSSAGVKTYTAGTAAPIGEVKVPALPAGHIGLAFIYVPASDTDIDFDQITDKRALLANGGGLIEPILLEQMYR